MVAVILPIVQFVLIASGLVFLLWLIIVEIRYQNKICYSVQTQIHGFQSYNITPNITTIDSRVKLHHVTMLGTHNSYHRANAFYRYDHPPLDNQLSFGLRQVEIDIHLTKGDILVYHVQLFDDRTNCYCLKECLMKIAEWKDKNSYHFPIFLFIEIKQMFYEDLMTGLTGGVKCKHYQQIQNEFLSVFSPDVLILPGQIQGNHTSLRLALQHQKQDELANDYGYYNYGWPSVAQSLGKVLPVILDDVHNNARRLYSTCDPLSSFFLVCQKKADLPYSSILTSTNIKTDEEDLVNGAMNGQIIRLLLGYGGTNLYQMYQLSKQYQINILSSDSVQCNDTTLCQAITNDYEKSGLVCNSYSAPSFCNSSSLTNL